MKDQVTELYRTMEQYGLIPKEAPAAEIVIVKKRGRPPKRPEGVPAQVQAGAEEAAPEAPQPQGEAEPQG